MHFNKSERQNLIGKIPGIKHSSILTYAMRFEKKNS